MSVMSLGFTPRSTTTSDDGTAGVVTCAGHAGVKPETLCQARIGVHCMQRLTGVRLSDCRHVRLLCSAVQCSAVRYGGLVPLVMHMYY